MQTITYVSLALIVAAGLLGFGGDTALIQIGARVSLLLLIPIVACAAIASVAFPNDTSAGAMASVRPLQE